jgi:hypothetical protein
MISRELHLTPYPRLLKCSENAASMKHQLMLNRNYAFDGGTSMLLTEGKKLKETTDAPRCS